MIKLGLNVKKLFLLINRIPNGVPPQITQEIQRLKLNLLETIPEDKNIVDYELGGRPMLDLEEKSPSVISLNEAMSKIFV